MNNFHIIPEDDRWTLTAEGGVGILGNFSTKADAVEQSITEVRRRGGSLKIHRADGTIEEERTYPREMDPARSPG